MMLKIDGTDYSHLVSKRGYSVSSKKILGSNSCHTLDGTYHEDVLKVKAVAAIPLKPMRADGLADFLTAVINCDQATFFDTRINQDITVKVVATLSAATLVFNASGKQYWNQSESEGMVLTIEER